MTFKQIISGCEPLNGESGATNFGEILQNNQDTENAKIASTVIMFFFFFFQAYSFKLLSSFVVLFQFDGIISNCPS